MSIKATHKKALGFYMFHCFNISKHISISVLFFITSVSCFVFIWWIYENNCPGVEVLAQFFRPRGQGFALSLCPWGGEFALSKNTPGFCPGGDDQAWK